MMTGAFVVAPGDQIGRCWNRRAVLLDLGAADDPGWKWYMWGTATGALGERGRRLILAVDPWCAPEDWAGVADFLCLSGWLTVRDDIGEPGNDPGREVWFWDLSRTLSLPSLADPRRYSAGGLFMPWADIGSSSFPQVAELPCYYRDGNMELMTENYTGVIRGGERMGWGSPDVYGQPEKSGLELRAAATAAARNALVRAV